MDTPLAARDHIIRQIYNYNKKGAQARNTSQQQEAVNMHFKALELSEQIKDTGHIIYTLNNIGTALRRSSSTIEAAEYHSKALYLAKEDAVHLKSKAIANNGLGNIYLELHRMEDAKQHLKAALAIEKQLESHLGQAINYANLGAAYQAQDSLHKALDYFERSLQQNQIIKSDIGIALCKKAIGRLYIDLGKIDTGLALMQEAVALMADTKDAFHLFEMQASLCDALLQLNRLDAAQTFMHALFVTLKNTNNYSTSRRAFQLKTTLHKKRGNYKEALMAEEYTQAYTDSAAAVNNAVKVLEVRNKYKNKDVEQQLRFLQKEKLLLERANSQQQYVFILATLLLSLVALFLFIMFRVRKQRNAELRKINQMKSRFFGNVSHEFRTPLTLIQGPVDQLLATEKNNQKKQRLERIQRNTNRLIHLVNQILSLSKLDTGSFEIAAQQADLSEALNGIAQGFDHIAISHKLTYKIDIDHSGLRYFDAEILEILVSNLLSNAFKFTRETGVVCIQGRAHTNRYHIKIANTAPEIEARDMEKFFKRFYTKSHNYKEGTGIGLSLVKELIQLYRAIFTIGKEADKIVFTIELPTQQEHFTALELSTHTAVTKNIEVEHQQTPTPSLHPILVGQKKPLLLLVEDHKDMLSYICSLFEEDYDILTATNGEEGIALAIEQLPDLILSDLNMPKKDGIVLCKTIKNNPNTAHIPIVLLTAISEEKTMLKALEEHADDYITKPFQRNVLYSKVRNLIHIRTTLANKYREEIVWKPANEMLRWQPNSFTDTLKNILENHISDSSFNIEKFCELASMSRTQLHRKLKATTGMSTTEFIRVHRIKIASELLKNQQLSISEICYTSGFENTSYFSKQFKVVFGCSPKEYRARINLP